MKGWMRSGSRTCVKYSENKPRADVCDIRAHGSFPDMASLPALLCGIVCCPGGSFRFL